MGDIETRLREYGVLKAQRQTFEHDWDELLHLLFPAQGLIQTKREPGARRTDRLFDTEAMWSLDTLTQHVYAAVTNFQRQFFGLKMRRLPKDQVSNAWLHTVGTIMLEEMTADDTMVPASVFEFEKADIGLGTACLFLDEKPIGDTFGRAAGFQGYLAQSLPLGTYVIAENAAGRVDTVIRDLELSPLQAEGKFGLETLAPAMQLLLRDGSRDEAKHRPVPFLHSVRPRPARDRLSPGNTDMPWESTYIDTTNKHQVSESGFEFFPFMVSRFERIRGGGPYGFGRGHLTLPEQRTLNTIDRLLLQALPMDIFPAGFITGADAEEVGRVTLAPAAMNSLSVNSSWFPYNVGQRFDIASLAIEDRRARVRRAFWIDQLQFLPPTEQRTQRTLGELQMRADTMARVMGGVLIRFLAEFLNPFMDVAFTLLNRAGMFPDPPDPIVELALQNEGQIDVDYTGALIRAQNLEDVESIEDAFAFAAQAMQDTGDALLLENIDTDASYQRWLAVRGFPQELVRDLAFVKQVRAEAAQQQQQQAQAAETREDLSAASDAAPVLQEVRRMANA